MLHQWLVHSGISHRFKLLLVLSRVCTYAWATIVQEGAVGQCLIGWDALLKRYYYDLQVVWSDQNEEKDLGLVVSQPLKYEQGTTLKSSFIMLEICENNNKNSKMI